MTTGKRAVRSTLIVAATSYFSEAANLVVSIILARLLSPEYFGTIALAIFFNELFGRVREFGFDQAFIHRQKELDKSRSTHFLLSLGSSVISFSLSLIFIPILARYYDPTLIYSLIILSFAYILKAASATQRMVLEKELRFGSITLIDLFSLLVSSVIGIFMAYKGFGLAALIVYQTGNILVTFLVLWIIRPWRPIFIFDTPTLKWYLHFGWFLWLGGITTFVIYKFNDFITGTFLSTAALGFYSRAFSFAQRPTSAVTGVVSRVAFPTYAIFQEDKDKLSTSFNLVLRNIVRISAPLSFFLFLLAEDLIGIFLGSKWLPMVPVFKILLIYGFLRSVFDDAGAFLTAIGQPKLVSKYLGVQAGLIIISTPLLTYYFGLNGAAMSLNIILSAGLIMAYSYVSKFVRLDIFGILTRALLPTFLSCLAFILLVSPLFPISNLYSFVVKAGSLGGFLTIFIIIFDGKLLKKDIALIYGMMRK